MMLLSIIVPMYESRNTISDLIDDLVKVQNSEIIFVDDGSKDNSISFVKSRVSEFLGKVKVIRNSHRGVSQARNTGIKNASGDYVMFVDSDDSINSQALNEITGRTYNADIICFGTAEGKINISNPENKLLIIQHLLVDGIYKSFLSSPWSKMFKKNMLSDNDIQFALSLQKGEYLAFNIGSLIYSNSLLLEPIVFYTKNKNENSITHKFTYNILDNSVNYSNQIHAYLDLMDLIVIVSDKGKLEYLKKRVMIQSVIDDAFCAVQQGYSFESVQGFIRQYIKQENKYCAIKSCSNRFRFKYIFLHYRLLFHLIRIVKILKNQIASLFMVYLKPKPKTEHSE